jgi:DNA-binding NarL/FixJ family response regulator
VTRVLVVDDHPVVRGGLVGWLDAQPDLTVVGEASDGLEALAMVASLDPDVVLMDLRMPRMDGIEATRHIRAGHPDVRVIALTTYADSESVLGALRAGASGYLTKDAGSEQIHHALVAAAAGQMVLDEAAQAQVLHSLTSTAPPPREVGVGVPTGGPALTAREAEIVALICDGLGNREIAQRLVVTEATVKTHVNHVLAKTGARDRAQLVAYGYRNGLHRQAGDNRAG